MARVRDRDTSPELRVRRYLHARGLHARGLRFRLHRKDLPGRPDLVFPSRRVAVFVRGCFWINIPIARRRSFRSRERTSGEKSCKGTRFGMRGSPMNYRC